MKNKVIEFLKDYEITNENVETIINTEELDFEDAIDIFEDFFTKFSIEKENLFDVNKYFYNFGFFEAIFIRNFGKNKNYEKKTPITVSHLIKVAEKGEWFDP